jgi:hypothetical protein
MLTAKLITVKPVLDEAAQQILAQKEEVSRLSKVANQHPFYKFNNVWSRELQNLVSCCGRPLDCFTSDCEVRKRCIISSYVPG